MNITKHQLEGQGMPQRFLSIKDVEHFTSLKKSTIYALIQSGSFPAQLPITIRRRGWLFSDVAAWIEHRSKRNESGEVSR